MFSFFSLTADSAKMIDIDHETKAAYSENLNIPGEEATLLEPNMDQIEGKMVAPNLTGLFKKISLTDRNRFSFQFISMSTKLNSNGK